MSVTNSQRQRIRSLQTSKFRRKYSSFLVEGLKNVQEVLHSSLNTLELYSTFEGIEELHDQKIELGSNIAIYEISSKDLERMSGQKKPHLMLANVEIPTFELATICKAQSILLLDGVSDPGNVGTLIRTADWFGIEAIISINDTVEWYNPKVVAAARGSLFRIPHLKVELDQLKEVVQDRDLVVSDLDGTDLPQKEWRSNSILAICSESHGPSQSLLQLANERVTIPRAPNSKAESLNAGVAGAILIQHWASSK